MEKTLNTDTSTDTNFLEMLFSMDTAPDDDDIHEECAHCEEVICGVKDVGTVVPDWVEINCKTCVEMDRLWDQGILVRCKHCNTLIGSDWTWYG